MSSFGFDPFALAADLTALKKASPNERLINGASLGKLADVREALDDGADPDFARLDIAPSLIATIRGHHECLEEILARGGHADIPNTAGWTALHEAAIKEGSEAIDVLLRHPDSVDLAVQDDFGVSALLAAMSKDRVENADKLVAACPYLVAIENELGVSPVFWAVEHKDETWLDWVIEHDPEAGSRRMQGKLAIELAEEAGWTAGTAKLVGLPSEAPSAAEEDAGLAAAALLGRQDPFALPPMPAAIVPAPAAAPAALEPEEEKPAANPFGLGGIRRPKH